ncbi:MAG TPA: tetratricopeptide repeat protein [Pyrinomonadaceae bacterium]
MLIIAAAGGCVAQQAIGPPDEVERFALELVQARAEKREGMVAAHPELLTVELRKELVQHGNLRFATTQYAQALEIYQLVEKISEQIGDKEGRATAWLNIGSVYYFQGHYDLAAEHYRKAEELFKSLGNRLEVGRCRFGLALTYQAQHKPTDALKTFEEALKEFEAAGDRNEIANTLASIGGLQYELGNYVAASKAFLRVAEWSEGGESLSRVAEAFYMQHDYAQALSYYERALQHFNSKNELAGVIAALTGTANCYYYQRNYDRALALYHRSLAIEEKLNEPAGVVTRLQSIGNVHRARGDYASALQSYFKSLSVAQEASIKATVPATLGSIGLIRAMQGDNAQAVDYFNRSLTAFEAEGDEVGMARMLSYIGNARYVQGQYDQALDAYERSSKLFQRRGDRLNMAHILLGIGAVYLAEQKHDLALKNFHEALTLYTTLGRKADMADTLSRLAAAYRMQGDNAKAVQFAESATTLAKDAEVFSIVPYALTELGKAQRALGRNSEALNAFDEAIQVQRSIRPEAGPDGFETERSGVFSYLGTMETLIDLDRPREALGRAEDAKSQFLREVIQPSNITKGMTAAERQQELKLLGELASLRAQVYGDQDSKGVVDNALHGRLIAARAAYEAFRKRLYAIHPQLAVNRGELASLNLEEMRPFLNSKTALVEYVVTEEKIFLFVVTSQDSTVGAALRGRPSLPTRHLNGTTGGHGRPPLQLSVYAINARRAEMADKIASVAARELYDLLLKPAETQIAGKSKLIVVPDGPLWDVPFETLHRASVSYAVSLSALREMRKPRSINRKPQELVVFANLTLTSEVSEQVKTTYNGLQLNEISTNPNEIDQFRAIYGQARRRSYTAAQASKDRLKTEANAAGILYFATPAILDHAQPMYSFVVLSPDPNLRDDGLLKLWEVTNLNSKARVAILPHTITIKSQSGNALIALSWAWFVAGTPAVILNPHRILGDY